MKRIFQILALIIALQVVLFAGPVVVQEATAVGNVTTVALPGLVTAGNSIIVFFSYDNTSFTSSACSITVGGSGSLTKSAAASAGTGNATEIWYIHNIPDPGGTGTIIQCTMTTNARKILNAIEVSGLTNAAPGATNTNSALANATVTTNSVTPATATNLVVASGAWATNAYSSGPTNGFTRLTQGTTSNVSAESAYLVQTTATSASTGWTLGSAINWAAAIAAFNAPTSGPTNAQRSAGFWVAQNHNNCIKLFDQCR